MPAKDPFYPTDAIVVLGGGIDHEGNLTTAAKNRVHRAAELYHRNVAPRIICTGRHGLMIDQAPPVTEARAMAGFARSLGVPDDAILLEEKAKDTLGNAYFVKRDYLEPNEWATLRVVTSDFHLSRAAWVFRKILGAAYDYSFSSAPSGLSNRALIHRALEESKLTIFLMEWLQRVMDADARALEHLMEHEHFGYAAGAPGMPREEMQRRLDEIGRINHIEGSQLWILAGVQPAA